MDEGRRRDDTDADPQSGEGRRTARRARVLKSAIASFNQNFSSAPCVVRNLSQTGARIEFTDATLVPGQFELHVEIDGYKVDCRRIWTRGNVCGVVFVSARRPTRIHRVQILKTSQDALSENTVREMRLRERQAASANRETLPAAAPARPVVRGPVFGQRR